MSAYSSRGPGTEGNPKMGGFLFAEEKELDQNNPQQVAEAKPP